MSEEQTKEQIVTDSNTTDEKKDVVKSEHKGADTVNSKKSNTRFDSSRGGARQRNGKKPFRKSSRFGSRPKPEFDQKIINISRVTRVVKGGRRLSFRVDIILGDKKGRVGLGSGKATDTSIAIQKAIAQARKRLLYLKLTKNNSIPHESSARITSSKVTMMPNKQRGLVAGSTMRSVLKLAGITDVTAQVNSRSKNKLNNAKAAIEALKVFQMSDSEKRILKSKLDQKRRAEVGGDNRNRGNWKSRKPFSNRKPFNRVQKTTTNNK